MLSHIDRNRVCAAVALGLALACAGCESYPFLPNAGTNSAVSGVSATADPVTAVATPAGTFTENLIQERTFTRGTAVSTVTYKNSDFSRTPLLIDLNNDGRVDPVVTYATGVVQILLSQGDAGKFLSLTLDSELQGLNCLDWRDMQAAALGDIDGDGKLDLVLATGNGVVYLHNPTNRPPTDLRYWGAAGACGAEFIANTTSTLDSNALLALITQAVGPNINLAQYTAKVEQGYSAVQIGDINRDGFNDIVASNVLKIVLTPLPGVDLESISIDLGSVQLLQNPGAALDGQNWTSFSVAPHERLSGTDRKVPRGLLLYDVDGDGYLDVISAAQSDVNVQVSWFQNPGPSAIAPWTQWRIGSVRGAFALDVADVTGDEVPDVVATGADQQQLMLFENPRGSATGIYREYDWDTYPIFTFEEVQPLDVKAIDLDGDGRLELVVGGTVGAVRYYTPGDDPRSKWTEHKVFDFEAEGAVVGLLGYGDVDGNGSPDLITVLSATADNDSRISWIKNPR